jgi:hypothetical protein
MKSRFAAPFKNLLHGHIRKFLIASVAVLATASTSLHAQVAPQDPGVRGGAANAGQPIPGLNANEMLLFLEGKFRSTELESTCDTCSDVPPGTPAPAGVFNSSGLGGRYNADQCTICHSQPAQGGSTPAVNPASVIAHRRGATNVVPSFQLPNGAFREVRFKYNPNGTPDGGVHNLWTVTGRSDAPLCNIQQPNFAQELAKNNLAFRIPLAMFGLGLIDSITDNEIKAAASANTSQKAALGITGHTNNSGNDGTINRFGWKAQNKSLTMFSGEAYNVEMGITNELFPTAREEDPNCNLGAEPNDVTRTEPEHFADPVRISADWVSFSHFMRFLDAPQPAALSASAQLGKNLFSSVGCAYCHVPSMKTGNTESDALRNKTVNLYSDLLVHNMGAKLADGIAQGSAAGDEFRSTPLWGVGKRVFFLHDGRTSDLLAAIQAHYSPAGFGYTMDSQGNPTNTTTNTTATGCTFSYSSTSSLAMASTCINYYQASEANGVINNFNALSNTNKQAILDFLRSL